MRHHRLIIGEDLPSIKVEEAADADAEAAGAEEGAGATAQHLHHTRRSRAHAARGPSHHQEVEDIFHHQREDSNKDVGSNRVLNLTHTSGTKIGIFVTAVGMMCPLGTPARHARGSQEDYDRTNYKQYIVAGHKPSTRAEHKTMLPQPGYEWGE